MHSGLTAVAAENGGPFTRTQALQAGLESAEMRRCLRSGRWTALRRGVYVETRLLESSQTPAQRHALDVAAAILALRQTNAPRRTSGPDSSVAADTANATDAESTTWTAGRAGTAGTAGAVGSHRSAAVIHGLELLVPPPPGVTLTRPGGYVRTTPGSELHIATVPPEHRCRRYGVPLTSPARTTADLARTLAFGESVVTADSVLRNARTSLAELEEILMVCAGWPGAGKAARVVAFADPQAESALESLSRVMFAEQRLPAPQTQVVLGDDRGPIGRADFYWAEHRTVGEADGLSKYSDPHVLAAEKLRQERLEEAGYVVVRFTWYQVLRMPRQTAARVRAAFARGASQP